MWVAGQFYNWNCTLSFPSTSVMHSGKAPWGLFCCSLASRLIHKVVCLANSIWPNGGQFANDENDTDHLEGAGLWNCNSAQK